MRQKANLRLQKKYNRLFKKLQQALQSGQFLTYSATKKTRLLSRLQNYENRLLRKGFAVLGTAALLMSGGEVLAQQPVKVGEEFRVNSYTRSNQDRPKVALDDNGNYVMIWRSNNQDGSSTGVYGQRYSSNGDSKGQEFRINTNIGGSQNNPDVAMDGNGNFIVVWTDSQGPFFGIDVYGQVYDSNGIRIGDEFRVNSSTEGSQIWPSVAMDNDGDFVVVWQSSQSDGYYDIYAQRYSKNREKLEDEFRVNTNINKNQYFPDVAMDSDGDFIVTWGSNHVQDLNYNVYAQRYGSNGDKKGGEFRVSQTINRDQEFSVVYD